MFGELAKVGRQILGLDGQGRQVVVLGHVVDCRVRDVAVAGIDAHGTAHAEAQPAVAEEAAPLDPAPHLPLPAR